MSWSERFGSKLTGQRNAVANDSASLGGRTSRTAGVGGLGGIGARELERQPQHLQCGVPGVVVHQHFRRLGRERRQRGDAPIPGDRLVEVLEEGRLRGRSRSSGALRRQPRRSEGHREEQGCLSHALSSAPNPRGANAA